MTGASGLPRPLTQEFWGSDPAPSSRPKRPSASNPHSARSPACPPDPPPPPAMPTASFQIPFVNQLPCSLSFWGCSPSRSATTEPTPPRDPTFLGAMGQAPRARGGPCDVSSTLGSVCLAPRVPPVSLLPHRQREPLKLCPSHSRFCSQNVGEGAKKGLRLPLQDLPPEWPLTLLPSHWLCQSHRTNPATRKAGDWAWLGLETHSQGRQVWRDCSLSLPSRRPPAPPGTPAAVGIPSSITQPGWHGARPADPAPCSQVSAPSPPKCSDLPSPRSAGN